LITSCIATPSTSGNSIAGLYTGLLHGWNVGALVGSVLGALDDDADGVLVGALVAALVGSEVGASDGDADGVLDGALESSALGAALGGSADGDELGAVLGEGVSSNSCSLLKIASESKLTLLGSTSSICSSFTPNHSAMGLYTASQPKSGSSRPVRSSTCALFSVRDGYVPKNCCLTCPPSMKVLPAHPWSVPAPFVVNVREKSDTGKITTSSHMPSALTSFTRLSSASFRSVSLLTNPSFMSK